MAFGDIDLLVDRTTGNLLKSFGSLEKASPPVFVKGDKPTIRFSLVEPNDGPEQPWAYVDLSSTAVTANLGRVAEKLKSGTFTITYGADTTSALAHDTNAVELETALNALASVTSAGGVDVTGVVAGPWKILFRDAGSRTAFSGDVTLLFPAASIEVSEITAGDGSTQEEQLVDIKPATAASASLSDPLSLGGYAGINVTALVSGDVTTKEVQRINLSPEPYKGYYTLTFGADTTPLLDWDATGDEVSVALNALASVTSAGGVTVLGEFPEFDIFFIVEGDVAALSGDGSNAPVSIGASGSIDLTTGAIAYLVGGREFIEVELEIEITSGGSPMSFQWKTIVRNNLA